MKKYRNLCYYKTNLVPSFFVCLGPRRWFCGLRGLAALVEDQILLFITHIGQIPIARDLILSSDFHGYLHTHVQINTHTIKMHLCSFYMKFYYYALFYSKYFDCFNLGMEVFWIESHQQIRNRKLNAVHPMILTPQVKILLFFQRIVKFRIIQLK